MKLKLLFLLSLFFFVKIEFVFSQVALKSKIAQMVMVGFSGQSVPDSLLYDLKFRNLGGVVLLSSNISNPNQLKNLLFNLQLNAQVPLLISVDQEGGKVARLNQYNGYEKTSTAFRIGTTFNKEDSTRYWANKMSRWLFDAGINTNLAPVVDVNVNQSSPAIGALERSFSKIPNEVFKHSNWFIDEFKKNKIISTLKHFPGHGSALTDSHLGFTDISYTWADSELVPFRSLIQNGYSDLIMMGHLYNKFLDSIYPASLSQNVVNNLLKQQLGFNGVIITDEMLMKAITDNYSFDKAIELAINAGDDILLYITNLRNGSSILEQVTQIVLQKISEGKISEARINESYQKIMLLKQRITSVKSISASNQPKSYSIINFPNPFNPVTNIIFTINEKSSAALKIYDVNGEVVYQKNYNELSEGSHSFTFDGSRLNSGIYIVRIVGESFSLIHKIVLVK